MYINEVIAEDKNVDARVTLLDVYHRWCKINKENPIIVAKENFNQGDVETSLLQLKYILQRNFMPLCLLPKGSERNSQLMAAIVALTGMSLDTAAHNAPKHLNIILRAIRVRQKTIGYVCKELISNRKAIIQHIRNPKEGPLGQDEIKTVNDRSIAKLWVTLGYPLDYVSHHFRADRELVKIAISHSGMSLEIAS